MLKKIFIKLVVYTITVLYLTPTQVVYQLFYRFRNINKISTSRLILKKMFIKNVDIICHTDKSITLETFEFFDQRCFVQECEWYDDTKGKLFNFHLNYHDFLLSKNLSLAEKSNLLDNWLSVETPNEVRSNPYVISLRLVNWCKYFCYYNQSPSNEALDSFWRDYYHLVGNKEYHILGNHLFANLKAIILCSLFSYEINSREIGKNALSELFDQLDEQILKDGAHFEKSPMYHAIILEDLLDIINFFNCYEINSNEITKLKVYVEKMFFWLAHFTYPDGDFALFNDTIQGNSKNFEELKNYYNSLFGSDLNSDISGDIYFQESGYTCVCFDNAYGIFDVGNIGPSYLTGHSHADVGSFELIVKSCKIFTNLGTSTYESSERRHFERSSPAHNTLQLNDKSSSYTWSAFRTAGRSKVLEASFDSGKCSRSLSLKYTGFGFFFQKRKHNRRFDFGSNQLKITDAVTARALNYDKKDIFFHLHPSNSIAQLNKNTMLIVTKKGHSLTISCNYEMTLIDSKISDGFNRLVDTRSIRVTTMSDANIVSNIIW